MAIVNWIKDIWGDHILKVLEELNLDAHHRERIEINEGSTFNIKCEKSTQSRGVGVSKDLKRIYSLAPNLCKCGQYTVY